jgi:hypothetical protein
VSACGHFTYTNRTPDIDRLGLGVAAKDYQRLGMAVLPLVRGGKRPHRMLPRDGGVHHASRSPQQADWWWRQDPAANVGVATGQVSRLLVIDLDVKGDHDGIAGFGAFLGAYDMPLQVPPGCWVRTPSGGAHIWLRTPPDFAVPERPGILPGVDIKGDGGLVVAPPSMKLLGSVPRQGDPNSGAGVPVPYEWNGCPGCRTGTVPPWMWEWLAWSKAQGHASGNGNGDGSLGEGPDLDGMLESGVPVGERNRELYRLACSLYRKLGSSSPRVAQEVHKVWEKGSTADFPWTEVQGLIRSARQYVAGQEENGRKLREAWTGM